MLNAPIRAAMLGLLAITLSAQQQLPAPHAGGAPSQGKGFRQHHEGPLAQIGLSETQRQQIFQIRESYRGNQAPGAHQEMRFKVLSVLTDAQRQQLFALEAQRRQGQGSRPRG